MTSDSVETANIGGAMVKAINRKPRAFQTPGEKSYSLEEHETRLRERLLLINRFEGARLERLQRQITSNEHANIGRILRRKDQMKVTLINIASSKRKIRSNVGEFERRLKNGTNSPVFTLELERIRRKEQELSSLHRRLLAPNSQLLAAHVRDELRSIDSRLDVSPSRSISTKPPSVAENHTVAKPEHKEETAETLVSNQQSEQTGAMPANNNLDESLNEVHTKMSQTNISRPKSASHLHDQQERHFPVTQPTEVERPKDETHPPEGASAIPVPNSDASLQLQDIPENKVVPVAIPKRELPPLRVTKTKKQKYLALMQQKLARTANRDQEISNSALQRERHAKKRVAELRVKTKEDIQGRRTADSEDSLGSIKQQEAVIKLQNTRKGSILPNLGEEPEKSRAHPLEKSRAIARKRKQRLVTDSAGTDVTLPPLRIDVNILKELKESRLRHRHQSQKLPKLP